MKHIKDGEYSVTEQRRALDGMAYVYRLILHTERKYSTIGLPLYSIEIEMHEIDTGKRWNAKTRELFSEGNKAKAFFDKLVRNLATPIDLAYIVEDEFA